MVNADLVDYIQKSLAAKRKKQEIVASLLQLGWSKEDVADSLQEAAPPVGVWIKQHMKVIAISILLFSLTVTALILAYMVYVMPFSG